MSFSIILKRFCAVLLCAGLFNAHGVRAALVEFQPASGIAGNGDSISLDLVVSGLGNFAPDSIGAFDLSVGYDSLVFDFTGYNLGALLGDIGAGEAIDASTGAAGGVANVAEVSLLPNASLDALQPGAFTLASLDFSVLDLAPGAIGEFTFTGGVLADVNGRGLDLDFGEPAAFRGRSSVPVPGSLWLLGVGIAGLALRRRVGR